MYRLITTSVAIGLMVGCGGGGGGSNPPPAGTTPPPAVPQAVSTTGIITGFGSVFVDGTRYEVASDTVVSIEGRDDVMGDDSDLRVGMKVDVQSTDDDGERTADSITYDDDLKGPVRDVMQNADNPAIGTFTVLGQLVQVDDNTVFDDDVGDTNNDGDIDLRDLELPNGQMVVEVSGHTLEGGILATRIDRVNDAAGVPGTPDDEFEIKGYVDAVADDGSSISINGADIAVDAGTVLDEGLVVDQSLVGRFVEVDLDQDANGDLFAVEIEFEDDDDRNDDDRVEIKGVLTAVDLGADPDEITIAGRTLQVNDASSLEDRVGQLVEIKGDFNTDGVLVIDEVEVEQAESVRTEDLVAAVDVAGGSFTTRLGLEISPTGASRLENDDEDGDHLTVDQFLQRLDIGDYVEARGRPEANDVVWSRIEAEADDDLECELRGPVSDITGTASDFSFSILGIAIDVSGVQDDEFETDSQTGRDAFFAALTDGVVVKVESDDAGLGCESGQLTAEKAEFELEDGLVGTGDDSSDDD